MGEDTISYNVVNGQGLSASATVTVLIDLQWKFGLRWPPPPDSAKSGGH